MLTFGSKQANVHYSDRRAAYIVIVDREGRVAMVSGNRQKGDRNGFLPGGGSLPGEAAEDTVAREITEEVGRSVRGIRKLEEVRQYFFSESDNCHYNMHAIFFTGEFVEESLGEGKCGEHELYWLPATEAATACFHECHAWAIHERLNQPDHSYFSFVN